MFGVANPAVIIGLGGSGKWVLTYVKKNLLETYGGEMPKPVRLLSFDTTMERKGEDGEAQEEDVRVGNVQLDAQSEFVYLGGNIYNLCREIRDNRDHPHIGSWLQARYYLSQYESDAFDISRGAGQKRPFGRMSIFYDLQQRQSAKISNKIQSALDEVIGENKSRQPVEIYVVASLAGGTGAGMFLDVAHLARWFANKKIHTGFAIRGFLALHNTFTSVIQTTQVQPQAFAALRELDRFMLVFDKHYPIDYDQSYPDLQTVYGGKHGKLFDNCYLLDASRDNLPLDGVEPKYGVYPSVADCISMLLDGSTGDAYAQHYKNVNTRIGEAQKELDRPIYSSLGTYNLILPVEDIITSLSYRFAVELLGAYWMQVEQRINESGQERYVLRYEGNAYNEAASLLRSDKSESGVVMTNFIRRVPDTVDKASTKSDVFTNDTADLGADELVEWIIPPEGDPTVEEMSRRVRNDLQTRLIDKVFPSSTEGDHPEEGYARILRGVRQFREEYLGREAGGRSVGGSYRVALETCVEQHRDRYQTLLQEYLISLLNGSAPTSVAMQHEKRGKLARAQALLANLLVHFADFSSFIERVKKRRADLGQLREAQEAAGTAGSRMSEEKDNLGMMYRFGAKEMSPAIKAQRDYIDSEQEVIDIEVNDLFFEFLQHTSKVLRDVTEEYKAAVDTWVATLVEGFTGTMTDPGLYRYLLREQARHTTLRDEKARVEVHEYVTDAAYEDNLYATYTEGKFAEVLTKLVWSYEQQGQRIALSLKACVSGAAGTWGGKTPTERNAEHFLQLARAYFEPLRGDLTIADRLVEIDPLRLARKLLDKCSPLIRFDPQKTGGMQESNYFVCVNEGKQKPYFGEFKDALRSMGRAAKENQMLGSSNPYTCTILATADVIASSGLMAYMSAEQAYNHYQGDARVLHVFPAEVNAVELEQHLPSIGEPRRRFSHMLTTMLESHKMVEQFILARLYKYIDLEKAEEGLGLYYWTLLLPGQRPGQRHRMPDKFALTQKSDAPSLFEAMETFVFRKADVNNDAVKIDFDLLEQELRKYEAQASEGDESRLINMFEDLINSDIEPMRRDKDPAVRDLGSLMRLEVDRLIESFHKKLQTSKKPYDENARPQPVTPIREQFGQPAAPPPAPATPPASTPAAPVAGAPPPNGDGQQQDDELQELQAMLDDGLISQAQYTNELKKRGLLPEEKPRTPREILREYKEMLDEGLITQEQYDAKVQEVLG
jgi:hypothetical protein